MTKYEYLFLPHYQVPATVYEAEDTGSVRINKALNHYAVQGWRVTRFEVGNDGVAFWVLLEREVQANVSE